MLYFIPFFMMHYFTYVLIPQCGNIEALVARALAPFDESLTVPEYKCHLHPEEIQAMAVKYNTDPSDHEALATLMPKWSGSAGGVDDDGLFAWRDFNPAGRFDWYLIGGRWDGAIHGRLTGHDPYDGQRAGQNVITSVALAKAPQVKELPPACVVSSGGDWHEQETLVVEGWSNLHVEKKDEDVWLREVKTILERHPEHRVVGVDLHQ